MNLRALLLDDEPPARDYLAELLTDTGAVDVVAAVGTARAAREALAGSLDLDVMFVDVQLMGSGGNEDGIDLVRSLGTQGPAVVLATAHKQHALEAFELGVRDYLHKPFTRERVAACVRRLREHRKPQGTTPPISRIVARQHRSLVFIELDSVFAFEADDRLTYVHAVEGKFDFDLPLSAIETTFGESIVRVHRNWLVNLALVRQIERGDGETTLLIGSRTSNVPPLRVPVARDRAARVRELLLANAAGVRRA
ncbi:LytTR family DNA-binding domain-containing protein [Corallococcus sp. BB11-1]|uniref:LytR/AlgR family response regulator transcription factor n=1 Tax=Corallococcus sp. BB11-1 TaxID=2996783 RepID=UPI0010DDBB39|nr:LytTR family DNA-binding domain-containing protein [Corallococcus sp. BB11-1]MCY1036660.1 LytTR family DNA-binding domain-containing protein [Corallococcus sp. BB11-1]RYZ47086.1 MAG: response regulator transcription factor [Myxococcaceae bacterium]